MSMKSRRVAVKNLLQIMTASCALLLLPTHAFSLDNISFKHRKDTPEKLRTHLEESSILLQTEADGNTQSQEVLAAALSDYNRLLFALYAEGRYSGVISIKVDGTEASELSAFNTPDDIKNVIVQIDPGPVFTFSDVDIHPQAPLYIDEYTDGATATGARARSAALADAVEEKIQQWRATGHANVSLSSQNVIANHYVHTIRADIQIDPGPRYTFGQIITKPGETKLSQARLQQVAGLPSGETFDPEQIERASARLRRTGAFRSVTTTEVPRVDHHIIDIETSFVEEKPRRIGVGLEYLAPGGLALNGHWIHRNVANNLDKLRLDFEIKDIGADIKEQGTDLSAGARLERPAVNGPDTILYLDTEVSHDNEPSFTLKEFRIGAGLQRSFGSDIIGEVSFNLEYSDASDAFGSREFISYSLPNRFSLDRSDDPIEPRLGYTINSKITPFISADDATLGIWSHIDGRAYYSMGKDLDTTFALRLQAGMVGLRELSDVPPDYLFYSGGGGTVRGHRYQSLGIDQLNGKTVGGRSFLGASTEIRKNLTEKIGIVGFYDVGRIGPETLFGKNDPWHSGAGLGLRYKTPIGPARIDIAAPIRAEGTSGYQIYIGIGQTF
jgi:translocation and assembly module TamA